jgi:acetyl-CoA acetyltransferase family protein
MIGGQDARVTDIFIIGGARTPMTRHGGALKDVSAIDLGVVAARAAFERTGVRPDWIDHTIIGNVLQTSSDAVYAARHVGLKAGVPVDAPAMTVNRLCGSGMQAAISGAQLLQLGDADLVLTGGIESMSQAPHVIRGLRSGLRLGQGKLEDTLYEALHDAYCGLYMAQTAELCAAKYGIPREAQDAYALRSQQLAAQAWAAGLFAAEVAPVEWTSASGPISVSRDDHLRADTTAERLAELPPAFSPTGTVTAGNASGIVDGGAALILASARAVNDRALRPIGRLAAWATVGADPQYMGMGPAPAARKALHAAGLALQQIDLVEINEAFAGQYLAVEAELGLDRTRTNVNGGAIALGHPLGMTGTRLLLTLTLELGRRGLRYGLAAACIGGGQGIAAIVERV